ncbi:MAG: hypothetical protein PVG39_07785 [Desulfobacteraceae bacterium]
MIRCTNCGASLPDEALNSESFNPCPICSTLIRADVFPAVNKKFTGEASGELLLMDDESSCFYHPNKQAVSACSQCGRFLCSLCDVDFNDQHMCISCIESGKKKGKISNLEDRRVRYDNATLGLAVLPLLIWPFTLLTAPLAVFLVFLYWNKPSGIIRKSRIRMVIAFILAGLQIAGWAIFGYKIFT